jgi:hypothetical protein
MYQYLSYPSETYLREKDILVYKTKKGTRNITEWFLDRRTQVGEDADLYERKPYGGSKLLSLGNVIAVIRDYPTST